MRKQLKRHGGGGIRSRLVALIAALAMLVASVVTGTALADSSTDSAGSDQAAQSSLADTVAASDDGGADSTEGSAGSSDAAVGGGSGSELGEDLDNGSSSSASDDGDAGDSESSDGGAVTLDAEDGCWTLTYTASWSSGTGHSGSSSVNEVKDFSVCVVDFNGEPIDAAAGGNVSRTQSSSNNWYSLETLAGSFAADGLSYSSARVGSGSGFSDAAAATSIRYNGSDWQYRASSSGNGTIMSGMSVIYLVYVDSDVAQIIGKSFDHIDVKTAAAVTEGTDYGSVKTIEHLSYTDANGVTRTLISTSTSISGAEWNSGKNISKLTGATTITISFKLNGSNETYSATLTADTKYPENTYYPINGDENQKLVTYLGQDVSYAVDSNGKKLGVYISGMPVFLVSAIVCNGSRVSNGSLGSTDGLDLVLNVATLLGTAPRFDYKIEKTFTGVESTDGYAFSFVFQEASVGDGNVWSVLNSGSVSQTTGTADGSWTSAGEKSFTQTVSAAGVAYPVSGSVGEKSYYYLLQEQQQDSKNDGVDYDDTVYGIKVVVETKREKVSGTVTRYVATVKSVIVYKLTANNDGGYSQGDETGISTDGGVYVFPFTNTYQGSGADLTIVKEIRGLGRAEAVGLIEGEYTADGESGLKFDIDYFDNLDDAKEDNQSNIEGDWTFDVSDTLDSGCLTNFKNGTVQSCSGIISIGSDDANSEELEHYDVSSVSLTAATDEDGGEYYVYTITIRDAGSGYWFHVWETHMDVTGYTLSSSVSAAFTDDSKDEVLEEYTTNHQNRATAFQLTGDTTVTFVNTYVHNVSSLPVTGGSGTGLQLLLSGGALGLLGVGVWLLAVRRRNRMAV